MSLEHLWAPWRLAYVANQQPAEPAAEVELLAGGDPACFLCRAVAQQNDKANLVVYRGRQVVVVLNRYPYNNGHLLVAPRLHKARLDDLDHAEHLEIQDVLSRMVNLLQQELRAEGFNIGLNLGRVAGAGLPGHLHWHVVPRWHGDTNFMTSLASARVIPQALEALWDLLDAALAGRVAAPPEKSREKPL